MSAPYDSGYNLNEEQQGSLGAISFFPLHAGNRRIRFTPIIVTNYNDTISTNVSSDAVFGRTDPIRFFQGNERQVQMSFLTLQQDNENALQQFNTLKNLMSAQYPAYKSGPKVLLAAPLFRVLFQPVGQASSPLLNEIGFLGGMSFSYLNPSEIINTPQVVNGQAAPRYFQVDFNLSVMHREVAGFDENGNLLAPQNFDFPFNF